jgi:hypothetical protein
MPRTIPGRPARLLALLLVLAAAGCGARLSGTYAEAQGDGRLEFQDDGTVYVTTFGGTIACTYELDDKHVIVKGPRGSQVLLLDGETLQGGLGAVFVKQ